MPSFIGRYLGLSFRTERLVMNLFGLVNSILDWSPIKWRNKLEQIWNLSLSQGTLIFDTIGEDTIKTVLSWIVITRIVIAHLYTFSYVTNIYPILTSSRPNLLLPWLILSFFKNVILEVIVIAIGLLLWYDKRFSLTIFLEFVSVKVVPLIAFSYIWYSNSRLFLELHYMEKMRRLRRGLRNDSILIPHRLYSKYKTRSLTTLVSYESCETYDTNDTISRLNDNLTPAQKTMKIFGLTEQDIADARARIREREIHRRLTEEEDETFATSPRDLSRFFLNNEYDLPAMRDRVTQVEAAKDKAAKDEIAKNLIRDKVKMIQDTENGDPEVKIAEFEDAKDKVSEVTEVEDTKDKDTKDEVRHVQDTKNKVAEVTEVEDTKNKDAKEEGRHVKDTKDKDTKDEVRHVQDTKNKVTEMTEVEDTKNKDTKEEGRHVKDTKDKDTKDEVRHVEDTKDKDPKDEVRHVEDTKDKDPKDEVRHVEDTKDKDTKDEVGHVEEKKEEGTKIEDTKDDTEIRIRDTEDTKEITRIEYTRKMQETEDLEVPMTKIEVIMDGHLETAKDELTRIKTSEDEALNEVSDDNSVISSSASSITSSLAEMPEDTEETCDKSDASLIQCPSTKKRKSVDSFETRDTKQMKFCSSYHGEDTDQCDSKKQHSKRVEKASSPVKLQTLMNCNCITDEELYRENTEEYCLLNRVAMKTSTPNESIDTDKMEYEDSDVESSRNASYKSCIDVSQDIHQKTDILFCTNHPLTEKLLQNDLNILKNVKKDQKLENDATTASKPEEKASAMLQCEFGVLAESSAVQSDVAIEARNLLKMVRDLGKPNVTNFRNLKGENDESGMKPKPEKKEVLKSLVSTSVIHNDMQRSKISYPKQDTKKDVSKVNIQRLFQDSMKVFDGCYEKDFATNMEVQCLLQQMEKKEWSIFPGQHGQAMLTPSTLSKPSDRGNKSSAMQDKTITPHLNTDFKEITRYQIPLSISSKISYEHLMSQMVQVNEKSLVNVSGAPVEVRKLVQPNSTKSVYVQTDDIHYHRHLETSNTSLAESKKRRKPFLKHKRLKEQSRSLSPIASHYDRKTESRGSIRKDYNKFAARQKPARPNDNQQKQVNLTKSQSDKSICDYKVSQSENRQTLPSNSKADRKYDNRKNQMKNSAETFGTIPLSQVVRPSMFDSVTHRKKPPVYPKKPKNEVLAQSSASNGNSRKCSTFKKFLETSKKQTDKLSPTNSKKYRWKNRLKSLEEQEAREMRALKAYNEITLLKDKQELETKRKLQLERNVVDVGPETSKPRPSSRKNNLERAKRNVPRNVELIYDGYLDKENLYVDVTTETTAPFRDSKKTETFSAGRMSFNEKYPCPKLSKVNKVADKLLDNFDRLHGEHAKQDARKTRQTTEADTRKLYTKYSKPKRLIEDENVSTVSMKKLEGTQTGRELERTPAKEDIRNRAKVSEKSSDVDQLTLPDPPDSEANIVETMHNDNYEESSTSVDVVHFAAQADHSLMIKSAILPDTTSSCSLATVGQGNEDELPMQDDLSVATNKVQITLEIEECKGKFQITLEAKDHEIEVQPEVGANVDGKVGNEMKLVSSIEEDQRRDEAMPGIKEYEKQAVIITEIEESEEGTEGETKIEEPGKRVQEIPQVEEQTNLTREVSKVDSRQKQTQQTREVDDDKREESEKSEDSSDVSSLSLIEPTNYENQVPNGGEVTGTRRHNIEVVQSEFDRSPRALTRNLSSLTRDFDASYSSNNINLSVMSDIVGQDTIRTLHNAFFDRSSDMSFNLIDDILALNDTLNNRHNETPIDEFIFHPGRISTGLSTQDLPPQPHEEDTELSFISAIIRQFQSLQEDHGEGFYNLFIASVEHEGPSFSFETADLTDIINDVDIAQLIINELGLNSPRILNLRRFNLGNILGILELLRDPLNEEEEETVETGEEDEEETVRADEEDEEETVRAGEEDAEEEAEEENRLSVEEERVLRFIKEDIFTNIKFPIVINWTNLTTDTSTTSNEFQANVEDVNMEELNVEEVNVILRRAEPSKTNLFSLMDDKNEEENELDEMIVEEEDEEMTGTEGLKDLRRIQEAVFATGLSSRQVLSVSDYEVNERLLKQERMATCSNDSSNGNVFANLWDNIKRCMLVHSKPIGVRKSGLQEEHLNKIYETLDETDEEIEIDVVGSTNGEEMEKNTNEMIEKIITMENVEDVGTKYERYEASEDSEKMGRYIRTITPEKEEKKKVTTAEETLEETLEETKEEDEVPNLEETKEETVHSKEEMSLYTLFTFWLLVFYFYIRYFSRKVVSFKQTSTSASSLRPFEIHTAPISASMLRESAILREIKEEEGEAEEESEDIEDEEEITPRKFDIEDLSITETRDREEIRFEDILLNSVSLESFLSFDAVADCSHDESNAIAAEIDARKFLATCEEEFKLRLEEQELDTLRYLPDDDSSSSKSSMINDEKGLYIDARLGFSDEMGIDEEGKRVEEEPRKGSERRSKVSSSGIEEEKGEEETSANDETSSLEGMTISRQNIEETRASVEEGDSFLSSLQNMETRMQMADSFDSTYNEHSEGSENYFPAVDLNESSMEEFANISNISNISNASNVSNVSNESGISNGSNCSNESETREEKS